MSYAILRNAAIVATFLSWGTSAVALEDEPVPPAAPGSSPPAPPAAHRGFQLALRTGYSVPFGDVLQDAPMADWFGGQVPVLVDIGGKPLDRLFIGGFIGFSVGAAGDSDALADCACVAVGTWVGVEAVYSFLPAGKVDPWLGYGLGFEYNGLSDEDNTVDFSGFVPVMVTGGVDFRLTRIFGLGPFVGVSLGRYSEAGASGDGFSSVVDIEETAPHGWFTLGLRSVFFP